MPEHCVFDNPKTAVTGPWRDEHEIFSSLQAHYLFDTDLCNPAKGNAKGSVENLVGYVRRNALVPVRDYPSFEALNAHLLEWSKKKRRRLEEMWLKEREGLRPLPNRAYPCCITKLGVVSKTALATFDYLRPEPVLSSLEVGQPHGSGCRHLGPCEDGCWRGSGC